MTLVLAYARERLTAGRLLPAVLLIVLAIVAGRGWSGRDVLVLETATALALVVTFRIWDDLADRERDRARHPDRVTVRAASLVPLWIGASVAGIAGAILLGLTRGAPSVAFLASYTIVLAAVYAGRGPRSAASDAIVLLKYGVFTLALIGVPDARTARGLAAAGSAFVAACLYEWWHDTESPFFSGKNGPPRVGGGRRPADPRSPIPDPRLGGSR